MNLRHTVTLSDSSCVRRCNVICSATLASDYYSVRCSALNLNVHVQWQCLYRNTAKGAVSNGTYGTLRMLPWGESHLRPAGLYLAPILAVDFVHGGKIIHIGKEDIDFHNLVDVGPGGF